MQGDLLLVEGKVRRAHEKFSEVGEWWKSERGKGKDRAFWWKQTGGWLMSGASCDWRQKNQVPVGAKQIAVKRLRVWGMEWSGSLGLSLHLWERCRSTGGITLVGPACQSTLIPCWEEEMLLEHVCFCGTLIDETDFGRKLKLYELRRPSFCLWWWRPK